VEQLLLHLVGDYITQTDWMAREKTKRWWPALVHVTVYSLPFMLLTDSWRALVFIWLTHLLIDRLALARFLIFAKNWINQPSLTWEECSPTGYPNTIPPFMSTWLFIITDNTMHLLCNYAALRWL
jgi:hypothetical protein